MYTPDIKMLSGRRRSASSFVTRTAWRARAAVGTIGPRPGREAALFPAAWRAPGVGHCTESRPSTYNSTILTHRIRITNLSRGVYIHNFSIALLTPV